MQCPRLVQPSLNPSNHAKLEKLARQVGRENPSELKAQKLARSVTRGLVDRDLKPDVEEKRQIDAILLYPPNRCVPVCINGRPSAWHA